MDKIENIEYALKTLRLGEIICVMKPQVLYFALKGKTITAKNDHSQYNLSLATFIELFGENEFYLYEKKEDAVIDKLKDDEYYQWKHK
ncbi:MAG: hypothetical protein HGB31_02765 [Erysipelotrichaceae bacterium]|jgi:hypothetical protein|nr:hypothetical protein [Erysipelotrichaceae bacterium]